MNTNRGIVTRNQDYNVYDDQEQEEHQRQANIHFFLVFSRWQATGYDFTNLQKLHVFIFSNNWTYFTRKVQHFKNKMCILDPF